MPTMRDGTEVKDPRLGRLKEFDKRSRNYGLGPLELPTTIRSKTWGIPSPKVNQNNDETCVGCGVTHELAAYPAANFGLNYTFAKQKIYWEAQKIDPWPGGQYPGASPTYGGTSVLAGVKIAWKMGYFTNYRWAFTFDELLAALAWEGPVIVGVDWTEDMFYPDEDGIVSVSGDYAGGHCFLLTGLLLKPQTIGSPDVPLLRAANSWGSSYGRNGDFFITFEDFENKLMSGADLVIPVGRHRLS